MIFNKNMKMADVIHQNYMLLPVINRFGIKPGFGDKSVHEICDNLNINVDFFLEIINAFHDKNYLPNQNLQNYSIDLIIDYLKKTHSYYLYKIVPEIEELIKQLVEGCYNQKENLDLLQNFFLEYKNELISHILREEEKVYHYIITIKYDLNNNYV